MPWASTVAPCLSPGTLKAAFFFFASISAWYSGYLLAELIPEVSLTRAVYGFRNIAEKPLLKGEYQSQGWGGRGGRVPTNSSAAQLRCEEGVLASALPQLVLWCWCWCW